MLLGFEVISFICFDISLFGVADEDRKLHDLHVFVSDEVSMLMLLTCCMMHQKLWMR